MAKSAQLQIRVAPAEKAALRRAARAAGLGVSEYVLARALSPGSARFQELTGALVDPEQRRYALAEIHDLLLGCAPFELAEMVSAPPAGSLTDVDLNYLAALIEQAAERKQAEPPAWAHSVAPLKRPWFATSLPGLRLHLLRSAPTAFKRRNLFVDTGLGGRA